MEYTDKKKTVFLVCLFVFLISCLIHYFSQRPLWLDERSIVENIKTLDYNQILGPLKNSQAFPRIYLVAVKALSGLFNYNLLVLRILPLLFMIGGFVVWSKVYKKEFTKLNLYFLSLLSFTASYYMVYYSAELKPYSADVFAAGAFSLYILYQNKFKNEIRVKDAIITLLLPVTLLFSYASLLFFWVVIYNFIFICRVNKKAIPLMISYSIISAIALIVVYLSDFRFSFGDAPLFSYWNDYFISIDSPYLFIKSFTEGIRKLSVWWFGNTAFFRRAASFVIPLFIFSLFRYGISDMKKERPMIANTSSLAFIVFIELIFLGVIKKYPFTGERITLFFAPFVFLLIVKGIESLSKFRMLYKSLIVLYILFISLCISNNMICYIKLYL